MPPDDERKRKLVRALKAMAEAMEAIVEADAQKPDTKLDQAPPTPPPGSGPKPVGCPADILRVLRETGHRLTSDGIMSGLAARGLEHADGKVKSTLSTMVDLGVLTNCQDCNPRGYGLADWPKPLEK